MGSDKHYAEKAPAYYVAVDGFRIDRHPIADRQFREFVRVTGRVNRAEFWSTQIPARAGPSAPAAVSVSALRPRRKGWPAGQNPAGQNNDQRRTAFASFTLMPGLMNAGPGAAAAPPASAINVYV